ncbi:MAG TPA: DUF459 domain-containing protein [Gallionellaceae bacterium]
MRNQDLDDLPEASEREQPARDFYWLLVIVLAVNMVLWLDSFDRYLNSRYHFYLSEYLPEAAFTPSRKLQLALNHENEATQTASGENDQAERKVPAPKQALGKALPASAVASASQVLPASAVVASASQVWPASAVVASASQVLPASAVAAEDSEEDDDNPKILFAGDSMMQGVAPLVISRMRKEFPDGVFVDASKQSTGLTVNRYFDWPAKIREETIKQGIRTVVIFLGPNDPWDIYEGKKRYAFPSDSWEKKYRDRVDEVLNFAVSRGMRIIWVGLPVMREDRIKTGAKIENKIFKEETKKYNFDYLPTEDLLGSLDEPYKKYITDPKKGKLVVRADDGIHFTPLGLRLISARVEEMIRKQE